ncbi:MAG: type III-A CRISPR-associated protein Cas10/Csm1 [Actinobacillus minor]|nr:type III-A CRISPR-associated protein Cas10/Csm1 [Actinobacillus minor]
MTSLLSKSCQVAFSALRYHLNAFKQQMNISRENTILPSQLSFNANNELLQTIISTANIVASGDTKTFNNTQSLLLTLFEKIRLSKSDSKPSTHYGYIPLPLSASSIFPTQISNVPPEKVYAELWETFVKELENIPVSHRQKWDLWLDHFDSICQCFTCNIPSITSSGVNPEVSLYDHSKTTAALATALWRWHEENQLTGQDQAVKLADRSTSWDEQKFLLIQGDFFGIQDFIFSGGSDSNKQAAKLLRGRSFQVSLFTELAALKVLQACELPSTSQMMNAAGKFLIIAPNTEKVRTTVAQIQNELNQWFVEHTYGLVGLGLATKEACCNDFIGDKFKTLIEGLFKQLEETKLQRLDLTDSTPSVQEVTYPYGICRLNRYFPAEENSDLSQISQDQITIGEQLVKKARIIICDKDAQILDNHSTQKLDLSIFDYQVVFTEDEEKTGQFSRFVKIEKLHRFWDFSIPETINSSVWNGYARRYINGYVPQTGEQIKTFDEIAEVDEGINALMTLKGDVDNLGTIFQKGLESPTFAKMAALSRQMNQFFSLWLPAYCAEHSQNMYTVFAGGDDFFLIGPWHSTQKVAHKMQQEFARYVAHNPEIHFSVGMVMSKVGLPVPRLGDLAEEALEKSKGIDAGKNAVTIFNRTVKWHDWQQLCDLENEIHRLANEYNISTSYLYSLIRLCEQANDTNHIENTIWRSRFHYRTARYVIDKLGQEKRNKALNEIAISLGDNGIAKHKINFAIPLTNYFYQKR